MSTPLGKLHRDIHSKFLGISGVIYEENRDIQSMPLRFLQRLRSGPEYPTNVQFMLSAKYKKTTHTHGSVDTDRKAWSLAASLIVEPFASTQ